MKTPEEIRAELSGAWSNQETGETGTLGEFLDKMTQRILQERNDALEAAEQECDNEVHSSLHSAARRNAATAIKRRIRAMKGGTE